MTKRGKTNDDQLVAGESGESFASLMKKKGASKKPKSSFASLVKKGGATDAESDVSDQPKPKPKRAPTTAGATTRKRAGTKSTSKASKRASTKSGSRKASTKSGTKTGAAKRASTKSGTKTAAKRASTKSGTKTAAKRASTKSGTKTRAAKRGSSKSGATKRASTKGGKTKSSASSRATAESPVPVATPVSSSGGVGAQTPPAPRYETTVAVFENGASNQKRAVDVSQALGYSAVDTRRDAGLFRGLISSPRPPELVLVGLPGGETLVRDIRELCGDALIIATLPGPAESARKRALEVGADLFVVRPHTKDSLAVVLLAAEELLRARRALNAATANEVILRGQLRDVGSKPSTSGFHSLEFFQRVLIMEIKRAKRFGYSLASALIGFERPTESGDQLTEQSPGQVEGLLRERVASAIRANIRDIDLPVDYADGRTLLFLPYTDLDGAHEVGRRVAQAVRQFGHVEVDGVNYSCGVSIGISAVRPGNPISFARLMKDATQALRAAQLKGGGQIVVRR